MDTKWLPVIKPDQRSRAQDVYANGHLPFTAVMKVSNGDLQWNSLRAWHNGKAFLHWRMERLSKDNGASMLKKSGLDSQTPFGRSTLPMCTKTLEAK